MANKRLMKELDAYNRDTQPVVASLEPESDDDLLHLKAVLRGPDDTAYEGPYHSLCSRANYTY
jgi:ubiquitin-protein ligase